MGLDGLRDSYAQTSSGFKGRNSQELSRAKRTKMAEIVLPALTEELSKYLSPPPTEENRFAVSEGFIFPEADYFDEIATIAAKRRLGDQAQPVKSGPAYHFRDHTNKVRAQSQNGRPYDQYVSAVCSSGTNPDSRQPCVGCNYADRGAEMNAVDRWAFEVMHCAWYHEAPLMKDGKIVMRQGSNEPILVRNECLTMKMSNELARRANAAGHKAFYRECSGCKAGHPLVYGGRRIIKVGAGHVKNIVSLADRLDQRCNGCGTMIATVSYNCGYCNNILLDMTRASLSPDELKQFKETPFRCPHCAQIGIPKDNKICGYNHDYTQVVGGCGNATPLKFHEAIMRLQKEGSGTQSQIVDRGFMVIDSATVPAPNPNIKCPVNTAPGTPMWDVFEALCGEPWDLAKMYQPLNLDEQSQMLQVRNPYV